MKQKEILYGAAYYLEYMPYDRMEKDFSMMKEAGMNVIRIAESTWSTLEPSDGVFDFSYVDRMLAAAEKAGLSVIIGTPTYAIPSWLAYKDPDIMVNTDQGQTTYGARQIMNIWNPTFQFHAERVIRQLVSHVAANPVVIGFQVDNETKHYCNYGSQCLAMFRDYLKETYGTCEEVNRIFGLNYWSNAIHSWEDVPDMKRCINGSFKGEYEKFLRTKVAEYLQWQADLISGYKREDQFITHNFDFDWTKAPDNTSDDLYSYGIQRDICHFEAAPAVDLISCDIYHPAQDLETGREIAFGGDEMRTLQQAPYLIMESQAQGFQSWTPYPGQLRLDTFSHLASGALGQMYWNWMSIHNSAETYWKGVLNHDLEISPVYEEIAGIGRDLKRIRADRLCIRKKNQVAIVGDTYTRRAMEFFPIDSHLRYNDVVRWMYDTLYNMNVECDLADINGLEPENYKMIIIPALYCVSDEQIAKLRSFVEKGGVLVASFKSFFCDRRTTVYTDRQPHGMTDVFGMSYQQISSPGKTTVAGGIPAEYFMELVTPDTAETIFPYEHKYWGRYAAATRNGYGKGKAYYMACYTDASILKQIYEMALADAGIKPELEVGFPLIARSGKNAAGHPVHYLMNYSEDEQQVTCPYEKAVDLLTDKLYRRGDKMQLKDWGVLVLEEGQQ